jgi:hypothetical protein
MRALSWVLAIGLSITIYGCSFFDIKPRSIAYSDGVHDGCEVRHRGGSYTDRDSNARAQLQAEYHRGWSAGFDSCGHSSFDDWPPRSHNEDKKCKHKHKCC